MTMRYLDNPSIVLATPVPLSPWMVELRRLLAEEGDVIVHGSSDLRDVAENEILILNGESIPESAMAGIRDRVVILLQDEKPTGLPDDWILLPRRCAPSAISAIVRQVRLAGLRGKPALQELEAVARAQSIQNWTGINRAMAQLQKAEWLAGWFHEAALVLETEIDDIIIRGWVLCEGETPKWRARRSDRGEIPIPLSLVGSVHEQHHQPLVDARRGLEIERHLRRGKGRFLVPFASENRLLGWFVVDFASSSQYLVGRQAFEQLASFLQASAQSRGALESRKRWEASVRSGLDEIDLGISILDKSGAAILANRAVKKINSRLAGTSDVRPAKLELAIQHARCGETTTARFDDIAVRVSPWGSLHNGCVLETVPLKKKRGPDNQWIEDFFKAAKARGLDVVSSVPGSAAVQVSINDAPSIDELIDYLTREGCEKKVNVSLGSSGNSEWLFLDQEIRACRDARADDSPKGTKVRSAAVGRRIEIALMAITRATACSC